MKYDIETLARYLTGNCDEAVRAEIEQLERTDQETRIALEVLRDQDQAVRDAFDGVLTRPLPPRLTSMLDDASPVLNINDPVEKPRRIWRRIAASVALVGVGAVLGYLINTQGTATAHASWVVPVAEYQALYGRETLNKPDATNTEREAMEIKLTTLSDIQVRIPLLDDFDMAFKRGQYLEIGGEPLIQLAYLPQTGRPLALCFKREVGPNTEPVNDTHAGLNMREWRHDGVAYVLVGEFDDATLDPIADFVLKSQRDAG